MCESFDGRRIGAIAVWMGLLMALAAGSGCGIIDALEGLSDDDSGTTHDVGQVTDTEGGAECQDDIDCDVGEVCTAESEQCVVAECDWCQDDQICYVSDDNPEGSCSSSACTFDVDCGDNYACVDGTCTDADTCSSNDDCSEGETCSPDGTCVDDDGGEECELDPGVCSGETPHLDEDTCLCAECLSTSHCDGSDVCEGGTCVDDGGDPGNGSSDSCETPCSQDESDICGGETPYCIDDCCVECIGAADCSGTEVCEDNVCTVAGSCNSDAECPSGYECDAGACKPLPDGGACDPAEPDACPDGQGCNPEDGQCEGVGGGDCGFCNPDCTCPGDAVCDGYVCTGCDEMAIITGDSDCPDGQECLMGICAHM